MRSHALIARPTPSTQSSQSPHTENDLLTQPVQRSIENSSRLTPQTIHQLQRSHGNQFVLRLLDRDRTRHSQLQRAVHYTEGLSKTKHPPMTTEPIPHTMLVIGRAGVQLESGSFASCVGVTFLDKTQKWGAIAHFWAGSGKGSEALSELESVVEKIKSTGIEWNRDTVTVALHIGLKPKHSFSIQRATELRKVLSNYGNVASETSGFSVSIQVPD